MSIIDLMESAKITCYPFKQWLPVIGIQSRKRRLIVNENICKDALREYFVVPIMHDVIWFKSDQEIYHYDFKRFIQMEFSETLIPN